MSEVFQTVTRNLNFWDFNTNPILLGIYKGELTLGENENAFDVYIFENVADHTEYFVTKSYTIQKAVEKMLQQYPDGYNSSENPAILKMNFLEQATVNGKPFNRFDVGYTDKKTFDKAVANKEISSDGSKIIATK